MGKKKGTKTTIAPGAYLTLGKKDSPTLASIRKWLDLNDARFARYERRLQEHQALLEEVHAGVRLLMRVAGRSLLKEHHFDGRCPEALTLADQLRAAAEKLRERRA